VPSNSAPGFEPGVDAPTRRALLDLRRTIDETLLRTQVQQEQINTLTARVEALEGAP
jgi:hypothetical protein